VETNLDDSNEYNSSLRRERWVKRRLDLGCLTIYPPMTTEPLCFNILDPENVTLELKPQYANMLPKFTDIEDAYLFSREFKEFVP